MNEYRRNTTYMSKSTCLSAFNLILVYEDTYTQLPRLSLSLYLHLCMSYCADRYYIHIYFYTLLLMVMMMMKEDDGKEDLVIVSLASLSSRNYTVCPLNNIIRIFRAHIIDSDYVQNHCFEKPQNPYC